MQLTSAGKVVIIVKCGDGVQRHDPFIGTQKSATAQAESWLKFHEGVCGRGDHLIREVG